MPSKIKDEKAGVVLTCRQHHRRQLAARARLLPRQHTSPISAFARQNMWKDGCKRGLLCAPLRKTATAEHPPSHKLLTRTAGTLPDESPLERMATEPSALHVAITSPPAAALRAESRLP